MKYPRLTLLCFGILLMSGSTYAQSNCGCDYTISADEQWFPLSAWEGDVPGPGDVICVEAGERSWLQFFDLVGEPGNPITIINCGGQVVFNNPDRDGTFSCASCQYYRITGTGDPEFKYGFKVDVSTRNTAMFLTKSDFEVDHVEIGDSGFAGMMAKFDPSCDNKEFQRNTFVMENISFHDNYIHDIEGEGFYVGNTSWNTGVVRDCGSGDETLLPHNIENVKIYNNLLERTGADGIQLTAAVSGAEIYNNTVVDYGADPFASNQNTGIQVGGGAVADVHHNLVYGGSGTGITVFGHGGTAIYNNIVANNGTGEAGEKVDGIFIGDTQLDGQDGFKIINNTIVNVPRLSIALQNKNTTVTQIYNNLLIAPGGPESDPYVFRFFPAEIEIDTSNNVRRKQVASAMFTNADDLDFTLTAGAPGINAGRDVMSFGITTDFDYLVRPNGAYDVGAHEFDSEPVDVSTPTDLEASLGAATIVELSWADRSDNETGFVIERSRDEAFTDIVELVASENATSYSDFGLNQRTMYFYRIKAVLVNIDSEYSNVVSQETGGEVVTSIEDDTAVDISIYPNPTTDKINLSMNNEITGPLRAILYDLHGNIIQSIAFDKRSVATNLQMDLSSVPKGMYVVEVRNRNKRILFERILSQ